MGYASKYYDPAKAHEYYEAHKQTKSRQSTATLNDEGKAAAKMVKEQLTAEKKSKIQETSDNVKSRISDIRKQLKEKLKNMPKEQKAALKAEIQEKISGIRDNLKATKAAYKEHYTNKYIAELDKIKSDSSMVKQTKKKSKSK